MKHRLFNRAFAALLSVMLVIGLMPVTALAAEEIKLFIGGQQITESGCYANQNGTWTKVEGTGPSSGQFYYDAATFTLTLNQAEITHDQTVKVAEGYTYEGSVIAFSQTADVSLKIVVSQGTSTITGTGGIRVESTTGNASLSIKGSGSLDVEPQGSNSGITLCSSKNTNLDIDGADVTASSPAQYGVYLISSTDTTSTSTIMVNNGSLTTGGNGNVGIYYYWSGTSNAGTSSLTVSGNAVVDTRNSQIMAQNKETVVQVGAGSDGNGGIVFNGKSGTVYGKVELQDDLTINGDETLTIGENASLTVPEGTTLTNNGTITNNGTVTVAEGGTFNNQGSLACNHHIGGTATCTEKAKCSLCGAEYGDLLPLSLTKTEAKEPTCTEEGNTEYWTCDTCKKYFSDAEGKNEIDLTETIISATGHKLTKTEAKEPTCTEEGNTEYWTCDTCKKYFSDAEGKNEIDLTETIISATGHKLTKTEAKEPTCTENGNTEYWTCESCKKHFSDAEGKNEISLAQTVIDAKGHSYKDGKCTVCGTIDSDFKAVILSGANGTWQKGSKDGLFFTSSAAYAHFQKVQMDGKDLDASNYTVKEGSTIVTLKASYLETLSVGKHTISIVSETGTVDTNFTIKSAPATNDEDVKSPQTGDNNNMSLWIALLFVSGAGLLGAAAYNRKRKYNR